MTFGLLRKSGYKEESILGRIWRKAEAFGLILGLLRNFLIVVLTFREKLFVQTFFEKARSDKIRIPNLEKFYGLAMSSKARKLADFVKKSHEMKILTPTNMHALKWVCRFGVDFHSPGQKLTFVDSWVIKTKFLFVKEENQFSKI